MIVVMEPDVPESAVERVIDRLSEGHFDVHRSSGQSRTILGVVGDVSDEDIALIRELEGVAEVHRVSEPYRVASRKFRQASTVVAGDFGSIGGREPWLALEPVGLAAQEDAPPSYALLAGRPFDAAVTRAERARGAVGALACLSIHARPQGSAFPVVFVPRAPSWGVDKWIAAAERELLRGGTQAVLLESGGEYPDGTRSLDVKLLAQASLRTHLPIVVDVPAIAQRRRYCAAVAQAALGAGAAGVILRAWVGEEGAPLPGVATLRWAEAVELAERLRALGVALRA